MNKLRITCLGLIAASLLAGCASTEKSATAKTKQEATDGKKQEYVRQTPTGSWISRKVKKEDAQASEQQSEEAQRALAELQRRGNDVARGPGD